jgi:hypothetical protein
MPDLACSAVEHASPDVRTKAGRAGLMLIVNNLSQDSKARDKVGSTQGGSGSAQPKARPRAVLQPCRHVRTAWGDLRALYAMQCMHRHHRAHRAIRHSRLCLQKKKEKKGRAKKVD